MSSWIEMLAGQALAERKPETFQPPKRYSLSDTVEGVKVKVQVMQRVKGRRVQLAGREEVAKVGARARPARVARAGGIGRPVVLGVPGVLDIEAPFAREELAVPCVPGGEDAVEEIDAAGDRLHQVLGRPGAHQVPDLPGRK